jgi:DNA-binding CsgD family transcriptional regulator
MNRLERPTSPTARRSYPVSDREIECLQLASYGKTSAEIGIILGISKHTVDTHLKNATLELDTTERCHASVQALRGGLIN